MLSTALRREEFAADAYGHVYVRTGMDPHSRQVVWKALSHMKTTTILIGTESLEECTTLSSRVCVLVDGRIEAIGSVDLLLSR